jgi:hypothetical protein
MSNQLLLDWIKYSSSDTALSNTIANRKTSLAISSDGSIYISGTANSSFDGQSYSGKEDTYIIKFSQSGVKLWTRIFGSAEADNPHSLIVGNDESLYVVGYTGGPFSGQMNSSGDAFVTKYSSSGTQQWTKFISSDKWEEAIGIAKSPDGSTYITGWTSGNLSGQINNGLKDAFITKLNSDGVTQWTRLIGSSSDDDGSAVTVGSDGSIYVLGTTYGSIEGQKNTGKSDVFVSKFSSNGDKQWTKLIGSTDYDSSAAIKIGLDGSIYIAGNTWGSIDGIVNQGRNDIFVTKLNAEGSKEWTKLIGGSLSDSASQVSIGTDGSIFIAGFTEGDLNGAINSGGYDAFGNKSNDILVVNLKTDGTINWTQLIGNNGNQNSSDSGIDSKGALYLAGWTYGPVYGDRSLILGDAFLAKFQTNSDTTAPTVKVSSSVSSLTSKQTATISFALSEDSTNFTLSDVTVSGGTLSNFAGTGSNYSAIFTPALNGPLNGVIRVGSGVFTDASGNANIDGLVGNNTCTIAINPIQAAAYSLTIDQWVGGTGRVPAGPIIAEGGTASFTLHSTNFSRETFPPGTVIPYTITGVDAADISLNGLTETGNGLISGNVTVGSSFYLNDVVANITVRTIADGITDGDKTLTVTVGGTSASVKVNDTSNAASTKEYSIQISATFDPSTEGTSVIAYIATKNVLEGSSLFYQISGTGITSSDFDNFALFGNLKVNASAGNSLSIPISTDNTTEGEETFAIQLYLDSNKTIPVGNPSYVRILDTSKGVGRPTYSISATKSSTDEGKTADFNLATTDVPAGSIISYTLSGINSADIVGGALAGSVTLNTQGTALISIAISADKTTEGEETLNLSLMGKSTSIKINDTSTSPGNDTLTSKGTASSDLVYVFKSEKTGPAVNPASYSYYYTSNPEEAAYINAQANWPWVQKASTFEAAHSNPSMATPVFRFWSDKLQAPYFTISTAERDQIISWSSTGRNGYDWMYAGTGFSVYTSSAPTDSLGKNAIPVYCVWMDDTDFNPTNGLSGGLLFTADKVEYDGLVKLVGVTGAGVVFYGEVPGN